MIISNLQESCKSSIKNTDIPYLEFPQATITRYHRLGVFKKLIVS
jgi:hypothetical protein